MPLTALEVTKATAATKPLRLTDGRGLYLLVKPKGQKWWRYDYRFEGKRKTISLGVYPDVSLADARRKHEDARRLLADGNDPSRQRQEKKAAIEELAHNSFGAVFVRWFAKDRAKWAAATAAYKKQRMDDGVLPWLGARPIADIDAPELLVVIRRIEERGAFETAKRVLNTCSQVFRYGIQTGICANDPAQALKGALTARRVSHLAAVVDPAGVAALMRVIQAYQGNFVVRTAFRLAPLLFVRPGELRKARRADVDLDAARWSFTASKTGHAHIVPLATQAVVMLRELHPLTGHAEYVFPSNRSYSRPMSENTLRAALISSGYDGDHHTGHGFRAMARTLLDEELGFAPHLIELQLGHRVKDALGRAYNRTKHLPERVAMMQRWADYLEGLRDG